MLCTTVILWKNKIAYGKPVVPLVSIQYIVTPITSSESLSPPMWGQEQSEVVSPSPIALRREQAPVSPWSGEDTTMLWCPHHMDRAWLCLMSRALYPHRLPLRGPLRASVSSWRENIGGITWRDQMKGDRVWENTPELYSCQSQPCLPQCSRLACVATFTSKFPYSFPLPIQKGLEDVLSPESGNLAKNKQGQT